MIFFNTLTITFSIENGYNVRYNNLKIKEISFLYNNKKIQTNEQLKYIGQTKNNLFLFDKKNQETLIYKTENIDNFKILLK